MGRFRREVNLDDLMLVRRAVRPLPFRIGDRVRLNSGSPAGLVVDLGEGCVDVEWPDGIRAIFPRACLSDA